jgi:hypothetical protein
MRRPDPGGEARLAAALTRHQPLTLSARQSRPPTARERCSPRDHSVAKGARISLAPDRAAGVWWRCRWPRVQDAPVSFQGRYVLQYITDPERQQKSAHGCAGGAQPLPYVEAEARTDHFREVPFSEVDRRAWLQRTRPRRLTAAALLHRALTCSREDRAHDALSSPAEHAAAERLIAAGLLEDDHGVLRPTPRAEATFRAPPDRRYLR